MVDQRAADHSQNLVAIRLSIGKPFQDQHGTPFATGIAISRRVKRFGVTIRGKDPLFIKELIEPALIKHQPNAPGQSDCAVTVAQTLTGQMDRRQRGGAGGVDAHRRPFEAKRIGEPPRRHTAIFACGHVDAAVGGDGALLHQIFIVGQTNADKDAGITLGQTFRDDIGVFQRFPGCLQQQPLLRVHGNGFTRRDPEKGRVKVVDIRQKGGFEQGQFAGGRHGG